MISKILELLAVGRSVVSTTPLYVKLATNVAVILLASIFVLLMGVGLIFTALYSLYLQLAEYGIDPMVGKLIVLLLVAAFMLAAIMVIQLYIKKIRTTVIALMFAQAPVTGRANFVVDSFIRGLRQQPLQSE